MKTNSIFCSSTANNTMTATNTNLYPISRKFWEECKSLVIPGKEAAFKQLYEDILSQHGATMEFLAEQQLQKKAEAAEEEAEVEEEEEKEEEGCSVCPYCENTYTEEQIESGEVNPCNRCYKCFVGDCENVACDCEFSDETD